jgi:hypothetical protein
VPASLRLTAARLPSMRTARVRDLASRACFFRVMRCGHLFPALILVFARYEVTPGRLRLVAAAANHCAPVKASCRSSVAWVVSDAPDRRRELRAR